MYATISSSSMCYKSSLSVLFSYLNYVLANWHMFYIFDIISENKLNIKSGFHVYKVYDAN